MAAFDESETNETPEISRRCWVCTKILCDEAFSKTQLASKKNPRCRECVASRFGDPWYLDCLERKAAKAAKKIQHCIEEGKRPVAILTCPTRCMNPDCGNENLHETITLVCPFCRGNVDQRQMLRACKDNSTCIYSAIRAHFETPICARRIKTVELYNHGCYGNGRVHLITVKPGSSLSQLHSLFVRKCVYRNDEPSYDIIGLRLDWGSSVSSDAVLASLIRSKGKIRFIFRGM